MNSSLEKLCRLEKHQWIVNLVEGKTFADIGGLWGTVNETVSIAMLAGASSATMVDIQPFGNRWWQAFDRHCEEFGVSGYSSREADICDPDIVDQIGQFDVVHCSGIVYHVSDPLQMIRNVVSITSERFIISSMVIPEHIENAAGSLDSPAGTAHLVPALDPKSRAVLSEYLRKRNLAADVTRQRPHEELFKSTGRVRTGPWWWLYSARTLEKMCEVCSAHVEKVWTSKIGSHSVLCRVI